MKKKPLTCQSNHVCIVIRKNKDIPLNKIKEYCQSEFERYAFIEHKGDIDPTTGLVCGTHYHIVGDMKGTKIAFSTRLNTLVRWFKFDNLNGIEIDQYRTFQASLQYLTHKNQSEKTPHNKDDIIHNIDATEFDIFYNAPTEEVITFELIYSICLGSRNIIDVIRDLGLNNYRVWRNVVWDIWKCLQEENPHGGGRPIVNEKDLPF